MLYRRRDFRPDKLPRLMERGVWCWSPNRGYEWFPSSPRAVSQHKQQFKHEHNNRQRTHNRKVLDREMRRLDWDDRDG